MAGANLPRDVKELEEETESERRPPTDDSAADSNHTAGGASGIDATAGEHLTCTTISTTTSIY